MCFPLDQTEKICVCKMKIDIKNGQLAILRERKKHLKDMDNFFMMRLIMYEELYEPQRRTTQLFVCFQTC